MWLVRLLSVALLGFGFFLGVQRYLDEKARMDLALLGSVSLLCGSLLYVVEPILIAWAAGKIHGRDQRTPAERNQ